MTSTSRRVSSHGFAGLALASLVLLSLVAGCTSMSGLGGHAEMSCAAPVGIPCRSVTGVYANARAGNLPGASAAEPGEKPGTGGGLGERVASPPMRPAGSGVSEESLGALRSAPTLIRIWMAPWEDSDGDLHDQSMVYLQVDSGRWLIDHNRARIRQAVAPLGAPASGTVASPSTGAAAVPTPGSDRARTAAPAAPATSTERPASRPASGLRSALTPAAAASAPAATPRASLP